MLNENGADVDEPPILDFEPRIFDDDKKNKKQRLVAKLIQQKFGLDGYNKIEMKTCGILFEELMKQVRAWSGKHADLIMGLFSKQNELRLEN